jgi:hypothetical protein
MPRLWDSGINQMYKYYICLSNGFLKIIQKNLIDKIHGPAGDYKIFIRTGNVFT